MKKILAFFATALLLASCSNKDNFTAILPDGNLDGTKAYLYTVKDRTSPFEVSDSAIIKSGRLSFSRPEATDTALAYIYIPGFGTDMTNRIHFINEKGNIEIALDIEGNNVIKGGSLNDAYQSFADSNMEILGKLQKLTGTDIQDETKADSLMATQSLLILNYLKPNMQNSVGEYLFTQLIALIDDDHRVELLASARPDFREAIKMLMQPISTQQSATQQRFLDITGNTPAGKAIKLSDYAGKGKVVLVDFWASWCPPCRKDMPFIVSLYEKYKGQGLEIVGVSLDDKKEAWTGFIKKANMTWIQMSDLQGWDSPAAATYKVESIPYTILIGKDGNVIAEYLSGQELENRIIEALK